MIYTIGYIVLFLVILYLSAKAFLKIKFHFWSIQPVFHIYDLKHWLNPNKIIVPELPEINKYVNLIDIKTKNVEELSDAEVQQFCNFIKSFYLRTKGTEYLPQQKHIMEYLKASNHPSFVSIYYEPNLLLDKNKIIRDKKIQSVISARPLHVSLKGHKTFPTYYVDNLCVNPAMRKKGIAPKAIQTLYYEIRRKNNKINNCLFKREGEMTAIVPLTTFSCKCYKLGKWGSTIIPHASIKVIEIGNSNLQLLVDYIAQHKNKLDCLILPEITNIANLIKSENIIIYGILSNNMLISLYLFRNPVVNYKNNSALELVGSLNSCLDNNIFIYGFHNALDKCSKKWKKSVILIDELGANNIITNDAKCKNIEMMFESTSALFLYNYASYTVPSNNCFVFY